MAHLSKITVSKTLVQQLYREDNVVFTLSCFLCPSLCVRKINVRTHVHQDLARRHLHTNEVVAESNRSFLKKNLIQYLWHIRVSFTTGTVSATDVPLFI